MGCDIHCYAEVKTNNKWKKVGSIFKNPWYIWYKDNNKEVPKNEKEFTDSPYDGRNYNLFSILAGVRNDYNILPISNPKGLPNDISNEVRGKYSVWEDDGHSASWLTTKELKEYDWKNKTANYSGWFSIKDYVKFKNGEDNFGYGKDVGGAMVVKISQEEADLMLYKNNFDKNKSYYVYCEWIESCYESSRFFVDDTIPTLEKLGNPEDVRIVFWFDS